MDNYKAENQEQEIDLVSLFFAVAHRYKRVSYTHLTLPTIAIV